MKKTIRSKAPFRIGLAGGGTDVSPYSEEYGGAILNATVNLYAYATLIPRSDDKIVITSTDLGKTDIFSIHDPIPITGNLVLQKGVCNRMVKDYMVDPTGFELITSMDVDSGSGLGTSSTLVVAMVGAFTEWLQLPLGEYDIAQLAYEIERSDLKMAGGKQDQYAATFGGVNFMEFAQDGRVIVNPLRVKKEILNELQFNLLLYYTATSRESAQIIENQSKNAEERNESAVNAMHGVKEQAFHMKEALLKGDLKRIGALLNTSWEYKKQMATGISNSQIEAIYQSAIEAGALGGKISGAGGGGFMIFYVDLSNRYALINTLKNFGGQTKRYEYCPEGLTTWTVIDK